MQEQLYTVEDQTQVLMTFTIWKKKVKYNDIIQANEYLLIL